MLDSYSDTLWFFFYSLNNTNIIYKSDFRVYSLQIEFCNISQWSGSIQVFLGENRSPNKHRFSILFGWKWWVKSRAWSTFTLAVFCKMIVA